MIIKRKFKVKNLDCGACCLLIDSELETLDGVIFAKTSYGNCECEIEFDPQKVDVQKITEVITKLGYSSIPL